MYSLSGYATPVLSVLRLRSATLRMNGGEATVLSVVERLTGPQALFILTHQFPAWGEGVGLVDGQGLS